jgi:predicted SnoaL-like aldol condensation-catalyzing enzyme
MTDQAKDAAGRLARAAANKQLVIDFYRHVFDAFDPSAVKDFVHEGYVQHCRHMPAGRAGLEQFVARIAGGHPPLPVRETMANAPAFIVAEDDIVAIGGSLPQPDPERPGEFYDYFIVDTYRVRDGKLAEHWSSINKIAPPKHDWLMRRGT